jgi:hypothetical protein
MRIRQPRRRQLLRARVRIRRLVPSLQLVNRQHLALRLTQRALLVRRLQLMCSLQHVNRQHLALRALLRKKPLEVKNSLAQLIDCRSICKEGIRNRSTLT